MPQSNKANWFSSNNFHFKSSSQIPAHFGGLLVFSFTFCCTFGFSFPRFVVIILAVVGAKQKWLHFPHQIVSKLLDEICCRLPKSGKWHRQLFLFG